MGVCSSFFWVPEHAHLIEDIFYIFLCKHITYNVTEAMISVNTSAETAVGLDESSHPSLTDTRAPKALNQTTSPSKSTAVESASKFSIPPAVLQAALKTLKGPKQSQTLWSHKLYQNAAGEKVVVDFCRTLSESELAAKKFLNEAVIGFDMEWHMWAKATSPLKENISVIQIACDRRIAVFHLAAFPGNTVNELISPTLKKIIESDKIVKTGSYIYQADVSRLRKFFNLQPRAIIELKDMHNLAKFGQLKSSKFSLAGGTLEHLLLPLSKDEDVRKGRWHHRTLDQTQVDYAAADAYASFKLHQILEHKRLAIKKIPTGPPFAELELPMANFDASVGLLRDLKLWRDQLAAENKMKVESVAPFLVMQKVAHYQPTTIKKIERIPGMEVHLPLDHPHEMLAVVKAFHAKKKEAETSNSASADKTAGGAEAKDVHFDANKFMFVPGQTKASSVTPDVSDQASSSRQVPQLESMVMESALPDPDNRRHAPVNGDRNQLERTLRNLITFRLMLSSKLNVGLEEIASANTLRVIARRRPQTTEALLSIEGVQRLVEAAKATAWDPSTLFERIRGMYASSTRRTGSSVAPTPSSPNPSPAVPSLHSGLSFSMSKAMLGQTPVPEVSMSPPQSVNPRRNTTRASRLSSASISSSSSFEFEEMAAPRKRKVSTTEKDEISPECKRSSSQASSFSSVYGSAVEGSEENPVLLSDHAAEDANSDYSFGSSISSAAWETALNNTQAIAESQEKVLLEVS